MALITDSTFDPLKTRCNVRLQQGVPIVDADLNELDDVRKFEMRAYLKWFVGDGIPEGSDGFRIDAIGAGSADDFIIRAGNNPAAPGTANYDIGLRNTGRAIVDGLDVIIPADVNYKAQKLFGVAGPGGLPAIQPIPVIAGSVMVYLDVWERLVKAAEDATQILAGIGVESCARMVREWCVRTRQGATVPGPADPDFLAGHSTYPLALLNRKLSAPAVAANIQQADLTDRRHKRLTTASLENRLQVLEKLVLIPAFGPPGKQFTPKSSMAGSSIDLLGKNFNVGTPVVTIGGLPAALSGAFVPTATDVKVVVPALPAGSYPVTITTDGGGPITSDDLFTVVSFAPVFDGVTPLTPTTLPANSATPVVLKGTNFDQAGLQVSFGATLAAVITSSASQISVKLPNIPAGSYTVSVTTTAGSANSPVHFVVT
jgi:hypothetical protein